MKAATRLLRLVKPENGGPRKRNILDAIATKYGEGPHLVDYLIGGGQLVKYGDRRAATWGLPRLRKKPAT